MLVVLQLVLTFISRFKYNGAYVAINGTPLSGWYVHAGRYSYDVDRNFMWLERAGVKKYAFFDLLLSEGPPPPTISGNAGAADVALGYADGTPKTVTSLADGSYSLQVSSNWSGTVTPIHPCFTFNPTNHTYNNVTTNSNDSKLHSNIQPYLGLCECRRGYWWSSKGELCDPGWWPGHPDL